jgi:hypothetical protein
MKKAKILFWVSTSLIFLTQGVMEILTGHSQMAKDGIAHLGYPEYFLTMIVVFKVLGAIVLMIPKVPSRFKEWAYAGFGIDFISAFVSIWAVDGFGAPLLLPVVAFLILTVSYVNYHKMKTWAVGTIAK